MSPPTYEEIDPLYREALATFEALRRLGFTASEIFLYLAGPERGKLRVNVQLHAQKKLFTVTCGLTGKSKDTVSEEWETLCGTVNDGALPQDVLDRIWNESECRARSVELVAALTTNGFYIPKGMQ